MPTSRMLQLVLQNARQIRSQVDRIIICYDELTSDEICANLQEYSI